MANIFDIASKAVQRQAMRKFGQTSAGKLLSAGQKATRSGTGKALIERLAQLAGRRVANQARHAGGVAKYAMGEAARGQLDKLYRELGPLGAALKSLIEGPGRSRRGAAPAVQAAQELLRAFGQEIIPRRGEEGRQRGIEAAAQALNEEGMLGGRYTPRTQPETPQEQQRRPDLPRDRRIAAIEGEIMTPGSSNVYSFSWIPTIQNLGTMYVTFQAPLLKGSKVKRVKGAAGAISAVAGAYGGQNSGRRGAMYAYYDVKQGVYQRFKADAAGSPGGAVWTHLRERGTIYGHQYQYELVDPATVVQEGVAGNYIPRRATKRGFEARTLAVPGQENQYWHSTLPEAFRAMPNRAEPNRGAPNRG